MAKTVIDYPISFGFKATPYTLYPYHHGIDYACPVGTPIVVSGQTLGLSGNTGISTGPHCHVDKNNAYPGKFEGYVNPSDWPTITGLVVFAASAGTAGNMIVIKSGNFFYRFLHLSQFNVKVNDIIKQGNDMDKDNQIAFLTQNRDEWKKTAETLQALATEQKNTINFLSENRDEWKKTAETLQDLATKLEKKVADLEAGNAGEPVKQLEKGLYRV